MLTTNLQSSSKISADENLQIIIESADSLIKEFFSSSNKVLSSKLILIINKLSELSFEFYQLKQSGCYQFSFEKCCRLFDSLTIFCEFCKDTSRFFTKPIDELRKLINSSAYYDSIGLGLWDILIKNIRQNIRQSGVLFLNIQWFANERNEIIRNFYEELTNKQTLINQTWGINADNFTFTYVDSKIPVREKITEFNFVYQGMISVILKQIIACYGKKFLHKKSSLIKEKNFYKKHFENIERLNLSLSNINKEIKLKKKDLEANKISTEEKEKALEELELQWKSLQLNYSSKENHEITKKLLDLISNYIENKNFQKASKKLNVLEECFELKIEKLSKEKKELFEQKEELFITKTFSEKENEKKLLETQINQLSSSQEKTLSDLKNNLQKIYDLKLSLTNCRLKVDNLKDDLQKKYNKFNQQLVNFKEEIRENYNSNDSKNKGIFPIIFFFFFVIILLLKKKKNREENSSKGKIIIINS